MKLDRTRLALLISLIGFAQPLSTLAANSRASIEPTRSTRDDPQDAAIRNALGLHEPAGTVARAHPDRLLPARPATGRMTASTRSTPSLEEDHALLGLANVAAPADIRGRGLREEPPSADSADEIARIRTILGLSPSSSVASAARPSLVGRTLAAIRHPDSAGSRTASPLAARSASVDAAAQAPAAASDKVSSGELVASEPGTMAASLAENSTTNLPDEDRPKRGRDDQSPVVGDTSVAVGRRENRRTPQLLLVTPDVVIETQEPLDPIASMRIADRGRPPLDDAADTGFEPPQAEDPLSPLLSVIAAWGSARQVEVASAEPPFEPADRTDAPTEEWPTEVQPSLAEPLAPLRPPAYEQTASYLSEQLARYRSTGGLLAGLATPGLPAMAMAIETDVAPTRSQLAFEENSNATGGQSIEPMVAARDDTGTADEGLDYYASRRFLSAESLSSAFGLDAKAGGSADADDAPGRRPARAVRELDAPLDRLDAPMTGPMVAEAVAAPSVRESATSVRPPSPKVDAVVTAPVPLPVANGPTIAAAKAANALSTWFDIFDPKMDAPRTLVATAADRSHADRSDATSKLLLRSLRASSIEADQRAARRIPRSAGPAFENPPLAIGESREGLPENSGETANEIATSTNPDPTVALAVMPAAPSADAVPVVPKPEAAAAADVSTPRDGTAATGRRSAPATAVPADGATMAAAPREDIRELTPLAAADFTPPKIERVDEERFAALSGRVIALADSKLDDMRGGFETDTGLRISFGIERAVYINGSLVATTSLNVADLSKLSAGQAQAIGLNGATLGLIQNGPGNTFSPGSLSSSNVATVVQNTLNDQKIQGLTLINATVNSADVIKRSTIQSSILTGLTDSIRR